MARHTAVVLVVLVLQAAPSSRALAPSVDVEEAEPTYETVDCPATFTFDYTLEKVWSSYDLRHYRCLGYEDLTFTALRIEAPTRRVPAKATLYMTLDWGHDKVVRGKFLLLGEDGRQLYERPVVAEIEEGRSNSTPIRLPGVRQDLIEEVRRVGLRIDSIVDD
ncbi:MAG: hypothetical protein R2991_01555 [Thermoanaerobaculia bacterium]